MNTQMPSYANARAEIYLKSVQIFEDYLSSLNITGTLANAIRKRIMPLLRDTDQTDIQAMCMVQIKDTTLNLFEHFLKMCKLLWSHTAKGKARSKPNAFLASVDSVVYAAFIHDVNKLMWSCKQNDAAIFDPNSSEYNKMFWAFECKTLFFETGLQYAWNLTDFINDHKFAYSKDWMQAEYDNHVVFLIYKTVALWADQEAYK